MLLTTGLIACRNELSFQTIPKVKIECATSYELLQKEYEPCLFELTDSMHLVYKDGKSQIKVRGNSTADCPRRPFTVKLSKDKDLCALPEAMKWVLLANWFDITMLRNASLRVV